MRERWPDGAPAKVIDTIEGELALIAKLKIRSLLPHRRGHRPPCAQPGDPVPGTRVVGQFRGLFRARHHLGQSRGEPPADGAFPVGGTQRTAGHRRGFRARTPRGSAAVRLQQVRTRTHRIGRHRDPLPRTQRPARRGQGLRPAAGPGHAAGRLLWLGQWRNADGAAPARSGFRPGKSADPARAGRDRSPAGTPAPSVAARGRFRDLRYAAVEPGAGGERGHGRPHHHPVGQGRPGGNEAAQGRLPGPGHADLPAQGVRTGEATPRL